MKSINIESMEEVLAPIQSGRIKSQSSIYENDCQEFEELTPEQKKAVKEISDSIDYNMTVDMMLGVLYNRFPEDEVRKKIEATPHEKKLEVIEEYLFPK